MKKIYFIASLLLTTFHLQAQTAGLQAGQKVEPFSLQNESGQKISLNDMVDNKAIVVIFTNNHCPYSQLYQNRLRQLHTEYASKSVKFLFIQPAISTDNTGSADNKAKSIGSVDFPYVIDTNQKVSQQLGATKTPEVFVLQPQNGSFILHYKGAIDDNPQVESYVKETYLKTAIDAVLANQAPAIIQKRATGCSIKRL